MNINAQRSGALHSQRRARPEDVRLPPPSVTLCCPSCPGPCLAQRWEAGAAAPLWGASSGAPQLWARRARTTAAAKPPRAPSSPPPPAAEQEEDDDIVLIDEGEGEDLDIDEDVYEDGEGEEDDEAGDAGAAVLGLEADDAQPGVETGGVSWAESALQAANKVLALPALSNLELYVFRSVGSEWAGLAGTGRAGPAAAERATPRAPSTLLATLPLSPSQCAAGWQAGHSAGPPGRHVRVAYHRRH